MKVSESCGLVSLPHTCSRACAERSSEGNVAVLRWEVCCRGAACEVGSGGVQPGGSSLPLHRE